MPSPTTLRLGARGSLLSRMQSGLVARTIEAACPGTSVSLQIISTSGDRIADRPLHAFGGKGLFTKELELALLDRQVDFAVHSFKDVPVTMPLVDTSELVIAAVPLREDVRDVLITRRGSARAVRDLPQGARVGTGSLRRQAQLLAVRPDLHVTLIRGNVDTRLRKLREGEYDAILLALAGLRRAELFDPEEMTPLPIDAMVPAAGQGALALQCRADDPATRDLLAKLDHPPTALAVRLERAVVQHLHGDCHSPIGVHAAVTDDRITLRAVVAAAGGTPPVLRASATAPLATPDQAVADIMTQLETQGVKQLLHPATDETKH